MNNEQITWKGRRRSEPGCPRPLADAILRLIWEQKRLSRVDIAKMAGLSRSTVSEIINEILPTGLVTETGEGPSRGGRRPIVLEFDDKACVILGVEMGGNHVAVALTDLRGEVLAWQEQEHPVRSDPPGTRQLIADLCAQCMEVADAANKPLVGIGLAVPSPIDPANPDRLSPEVMPAWEATLGLQNVGKRYNVPMFVDNDANCGALAEHWWSEHGKTEHLAYIKVATGIGSGHIIGGEIYRGATGVAGEIGHLSIDPKGKICRCGLHGCLVTLAGGEAIIERVGELLPEYPDSVLAGRKVRLFDIEEASLAGDPLALQIIGETAQYLGTAVAGMLNLLNPATVIFGGDLARLGDLLLEPVRQTIRTRTLVSSVSAAEIHTSSLGPRSVTIGAATLVLKAALEDSRVFPKVAVG